MEEARHYYTDEKNAQIVIALLKAHGIRRVIANPGTTNIAIVGSVQNDPWFEVYSGVDERHSAYMAVGMAAESGEPVVLSCTGATASRNYIPALTEAYYRKLPILVITSMHGFEGVGQLTPQVLDRTVQPKDCVIKSVQCRVVKDAHDAKVCERIINDAILELTHHGGGPVHINLENSYCMTFKSTGLPAAKKVVRYSADRGVKAPPLTRNSKVALFVGSGRIEKSWEEFAIGHNVAVFADEGSQYAGPNRISASLLCSQVGFRSNPKYAHLSPDLIIDIGEVSGDYPTLGYFEGRSNVWRVSLDGEVKSRFGLPSCVFEMSARCFVDLYSTGESKQCSQYAEDWKLADRELRKNLPDIPFSNPWMASRLSPLFPAGSVLHLAILNSLRSYNLFSPVRAVTSYCNVGGFGIDGGMSTLIGGSLIPPGVLHFGVIGDLAFFYDLNSLGNRHIGKNLRILLVNNGCGSEFNMYFHPGSQFGEQTNDFIAAGRHFGDKSKTLVRHYVEDLGFLYLSAEDKGSFEKNLSTFLSEECEKPIVFECFTHHGDESKAHELLNNIDAYTGDGRTLAGAVKGMVPRRVKNAITELLR